MTGKYSRKPQKLDKRWILKSHDGKCPGDQLQHFDLQIPDTDLESVVGAKIKYLKCFAKGRSKNIEKKGSMGIEESSVKEPTITSRQNTHFIKKCQHIHMTKLKQATEAIRQKNCRQKLFF